jgi:hypothetical protein
LSDRISLGRMLLTVWRNRIKPLWQVYEVPLFIIIVIVTFILGVIGFGSFFAAHGEQRPVLDWMFLTVIMFRGIVLQAGPLPLALEIARWVAMFIVMYALLRGFTALFYDQASLLVLRWLTAGHVVICGATEAGARLAAEFYKQGYGVVVIDRGLSKEMAARYRDQGSAVVAGSGDMESLRKARLDRAKYLIAAMEDDGANAAAALAARELISRMKGDTPLTCYIHIQDRGLCNLLKADYEFNRTQSDALRLEFFNVYDDSARALLKEFPADSEGSGRIAVAGSGRLAESLILRAAIDGLFYGHSRRLNVTLLDPGATKKKARLMASYPILGSTCDITAIDADPLAADTAAIKGARTVYICMDKDGDGLSAALSLKKKLDGGTRIVACMGRSSGLSKLVDRIGKEQGLDGLSFFSMLDATSKPEVLLGGMREALAMAIHDDYLRLQVKDGIRPEMNPSMTPWDSLPEGLKESNRHNADHLLVKLAAAGYGIELLTDAGAPDFKFTKDEIEKMSVIEHDRWVDERRQQGWTYTPGPKDLDKKTSPYMVPWEELTEEIREYDRNVIRGLPMSVARAGFQVCRIRPAKAIEPIKVKVV